MRIEEKSRKVSEISFIILQSCFAVFVFVMCLFVCLFFCRYLKSSCCPSNSITFIFFLRIIEFHPFSFTVKNLATLFCANFGLVHSGINSRAATLCTEAMPVGHEELTGRLETLRNSEIQ